jgi:uncharacterized integral membrane protein (TIGR00698 family)
MMAILLGILVNNLFKLPEFLRPGIKFSVVRILRLGIVLLGIRLSIVEAGAIGLKALPVIIGTILAAIAIVTYVSRRVGLTDRLGTLIGVGTSICGATAIVAMSPTIGAKDDETAYAVACITLFGVVAMLAYPFAAHWLFDGDAFRSGMFLGTAVHETAQVAGAGLVYQEYFKDPQALDVATVTKLVRNLSMLVVIPIMAVLYHRRSSEGGTAPKWYTMIPLFIVGFAAMSVLRTVGDMGERAFGVLEPAQCCRLRQAGGDVLPRHRHGGGGSRHQYQGPARHRPQAAGSGAVLGRARGHRQLYADLRPVLSDCRTAVRAPLVRLCRSGYRDKPRWQRRRRSSSVRP